MSIPLVQNNEKDSINTSIIAIKKNLERINSILGLVDSGNDIDTSEFVKKSDIVDVVQSGNMNPVTSNAVVPVDTVTSGDMHSVTSNAVAGAIKKEVIVNNENTDVGNGKYSLFKAGNVIELDISGLSLAINSGNILLTIPQAYRPSKDILVVGYNGGGNYSTSNNLNFIIQSSGSVYLYTYVACSGNGTNLHATWVI